MKPGGTSDPHFRFFHAAETIVVRSGFRAPTRRKKEEIMERKGNSLFALCVSLLLAASTSGVTLAADDALPSKSDSGCMKCHEYNKTPGTLAGKLSDVSSKANAIQMQIDKDMEVVYFDDATVLKNAPSFKEIPKQESIKVTYFKKDGKAIAKEVEVKKGIAVPKEQLATVEEVAKLVNKGPEKGKYILIDSRPTNLYDEGHIPTAVSMPFFAFDKMAGDLLKNKDALQIYYCAGFS